MIAATSRNPTTAAPSRIAFVAIAEDDTAGRPANAGRHGCRLEPKLR